MPNASQSIVVGTWRVVRSELLLSCEVYVHFSSDGEHFWEYPYPPVGVPRLCRFHYRMCEHGVFVKPANGYQEGWEVRFTREDERLVFVHSSGKRSWLERITAEQRPNFLTVFYEPPEEFTMA